MRVVCAYGVTDRHGARRRPARAWPRTSGSSAPAAGAWSACTPRSRCRDDTLEAAAGLAADLGVGVHIHVAEGPVDARRRRRASADLRRRRLAARALRAPRPRPARHDRPQPALEHEQRGRLRPPGPRPQPGRARHRRHRRRHARGVPPRLRAPARGRRRRPRPTTAWSWLETGYRLVPEAPRRPGDVALRPRRWTVAPRVHARRARRSRSRSTARSCSTTARPTRVDADEVRARAAEQAARLFHAAAETRLMARRVALYLQDAHPIREAWASCSTPRPRASTRCGRPRAGSCARRRSRWPRSPP